MNDTARQAAWEALEFWLDGKGWVLEGLANFCIHLDSRDRALAYEIALGTCRRKARLEAVWRAYAARKPARRVATLLELSFYQLFFMDRIPAHAVLDTAAQLVRHARLGEATVKFVNAVLRRAQREGLPPLPARALPRLAQEYSAPVWLLRRWLKEGSPQEVESRLRPALETPLQWIRVHAGKTTAAELCEKLEQQPIAQHGTQFMAFADGARVVRHPLFAEGCFSVQNPSALLVAQLLDAHAGQLIWDACAAPGGKSALLAESDPALTIIASDIQFRRVLAMHDLHRRSELRNVHICTADALQPPWEPVFDRVLLDVPCSNLGVLGRRPEVLQRLREQEFDALPELQYSVLENASRCLKPDGVLVYATCSPEPAETTAVIQRFLKANPHFVLEPAAQYVDASHTQKEYLLVKDNTIGLDRFFAARLRKRK